MKAQEKTRMYEYIYIYVYMYTHIGFQSFVNLPGTSNGTLRTLGGPKKG